MERVICVVQCPNVMDRLRDYIDMCVQDHTWEVDWNIVMNAASHAAAGEYDAMATAFEVATGIPLAHPVDYGTPQSLGRIAEFIEALGHAIRHALRGMLLKDCGKLVKCRYLEMTRQFFIFEVQLEQPFNVGDVA